jgi:outer membrane protein assembly factor BamA
VDYEPEQKPAQVNVMAFAKYTYRRQYYSQHSLRMEYQNHNAADSVVFVNPNYLGRDLQNGEPLTTLQYFKLAYEFRHDVRDSRIYPLEGIMVKLNVRQLGLGIFPDFPYPTLQLMGVLMYHQQLKGRFYFYNTTKARYSSEKRPSHIFNRGLGYHEWLTAYEPYVLDGSDYFISKYNLKFELIRPTTRTLPLINMEQFNKIHYAVYINLFADAGYVHNEFPDPTNTMLNTFQFSAGIGIDLVTYYDQVFRVDFAVNRYGEYGVFLHLETPFFRW